MICELNNPLQVYLLCALIYMAVNLSPSQVTREIHRTQGGHGREEDLTGDGDVGGPLVAEKEAVPAGR